jgi:proteic killer suppression protein
VINSFRHKGLQRFFTSGTKVGIVAEHADRLKLILGRLQVSVAPTDMDLPGLKLHRLKGNLKNRWSVAVSGNWRVTFSFLGKDAIHVDYEDYH